MPTKTIAELSWAVAREMSSAVASEVDGGSTLVRTDRVMVPTISDFVYQDGGGLGYSTSYVLSDVKNPDITRINQIVSRISDTELFMGFQTEVMKAIGPGGIEYTLAPSTFLTNCAVICAELADGGKRAALDFERGLAAYVSTYIARIAGAPAEMAATVWIDGIWLRVDSIALKESIVLRRPNPDDLVNEMTRYRGFPTVGMRGPPPLTSAAAEITVLVRAPTSLQERVDMVCSALRLYAECSAIATRIDFRAEGYIGGGGQQWSNLPIIVGPKAPIGSEDIEPLTRLLSYLEMSPLLGPKSGQDENPIKIAFARYSESLSGSTLPEARITAAITALEALYLESEAKSEITHRLSQRVSVLFACLGQPPIEIYQKVSSAYEVRSRFIHGSGSAGPERKTMDKLLERILEIDRLSIIVLLQLMAEESKDQIISRIDRAVLEPASRDALRSRVEKIDLFKRAS